MRVWSPWIARASLVVTPLALSKYKYGGPQNPCGLVFNDDSEDCLGCVWRRPNIESAIREDATIPNSVSRIVPLTYKFRFKSPEEFEEKVRLLVDGWLAELKGKSFHVRMHRRGFKGRLSSQLEEQCLDHHLLERLAQEGAQGRLDFDDPDVIIAVETLGQTAGLSLWAREQRQSFELLDLD
jgi:tRNA(Ser,Leu) C12 N-acetylase TAN1